MEKEKITAKDELREVKRKGFEDGYILGFRDGILRGCKEEKQEAVRFFLSIGRTVDAVSNIMDMSPEEVKNSDFINITENSMGGNDNE